RPSSLNVPPKTSPSTPRPGRKLKTPGSDSDFLSSPSPVRKTSKDKSPNVVDRRSPRSPAVEKKKPIKASEMESQLAHLQDELKNANDQLGSSESCKKKAQQEADEAKIQLASTLAELGKTQKQLNELSDSEDTRIQELRKISQERDKEWQSELEAVQKQHSMDSAALASALNEIQRLKTQVSKISESEASQAKQAESAHAEIHGLRVELTKTLELVETLRSQLSDSRESEERALEEVGRAQVELEIVKSTEERVKSENVSVMESYESLQAELEESKSKVNFLEGLVCKFQSENGLKNEASQLREALENAEKRCQDQRLEIKDANDLGKRAKMESCEREAEFEAKLNESRGDNEELKTKLIENENELKKSEIVFEELKAKLLEKEMRAQSIEEENETLKSEITKKEIEKSEEKREALMKLGYLTEEADKSSRKAERLAEQLDAAQAAGSEMEAELRRLKVQSDQWRKAAEAAAGMLSTGKNEKYVEKMGNLDYGAIGGKIGSPFSEDESVVKKNGNMLKKMGFGVLLKKGGK
ncbi:interactor of constitutive active rops 2 chloroplastic, partial [Phtheirospermum japonicum]